MIMCLFPRTQFVCRLIGEVGGVGGGSMIMCLFPRTQFVCRLIGEVGGWGGGEYDNVSFPPHSVCVQINW